MSARLARMVMRVDGGLHGTLAGIAERLLAETRIEHSQSAVVRGLIALGLATVAGNDVLAPLFAGARVARGRKRGARRRPIAGLDLTFEEEHHEARERREVV